MKRIMHKRSIVLTFQSENEALLPSIADLKEMIHGTQPGKPFIYANERVKMDYLGSTMQVELREFHWCRLEGYLPVVGDEKHVDWYQNVNTKISGDARVDADGNKFSRGTIWAEDERDAYERATRMLEKK